MGKFNVDSFKNYLAQEIVQEFEWEDVKGKWDLTVEEVTDEKDDIHRVFTLTMLGTTDRFVVREKIELDRLASDLVIEYTGPE